MRRWDEAGAIHEGTLVYCGWSDLGQWLTAFTASDALEPGARPGAAGTAGRPGPIPDVALGGGRVLNSRLTDDGRLELLSRELERVTSSGAVQLGPPKEVTAVEPEDFGGSSVEVSGDYVLTVNSTEGFMLRVGARPAINLSPADPELNRIRQSGRYSLAGGVIYRPAPGNQAVEVFRTGTDNTDIFGPKIAWVTATGR